MLKSEKDVFEFVLDESDGNMCKLRRVEPSKILKIFLQIFIKSSWFNEKSKKVTTLNK